MKKIRLVLLALGVTAFLSFCVSTGSLERTGAQEVAAASQTSEAISN